MRTVHLLTDDNVLNKATGHTQPEIQIKKALNNRIHDYRDTCTILTISPLVSFRLYYQTRIEDLENSKKCIQNTIREIIIEKHKTCYKNVDCNNSVTQNTKVPLEKKMQRSIRMHLKFVSQLIMFHKCRHKFLRVSITFCQTIRHLISCRYPINRHLATLHHLSNDCNVNP